MLHSPKRIGLFLAKIEVNPKTGCWQWLGCIDQCGYGRFRYSGKTGRAHRFAYETFVGQIPEGLQLDHLCRNRSCACPDHLEAVTGKVNINRGTKHKLTLTHCPHGHPYDEENTYYQIDPTRGQHRLCRICRKFNNERRRKQSTTSTRLSTRVGRESKNF